MSEGGYRYIIAPPIWGQGVGKFDQHLQQHLYCHSKGNFLMRATPHNFIVVEMKRWVSTFLNRWTQIG